jgi:O-antigen/teichoic acid export membrane protein
MNQTWIKYLPAFIREKIKERVLLQKTIRNTGWMMGDKIIRKIAGIVVGVWLARYLGPQLYGEFSYAIAVVMIVMPITVLGLDDITIRRMVQDSGRRDEILGSSFIMMILGGVASFGLAMAAIFIARPEDALVHWLVGIVAAGNIFYAFNVIEFWFESQLQWEFTVYAKTSAFLLLCLVKIVLIIFKAPLIAFAWAALADSLACSAGLVVVYWKKGYAIKVWRFSQTMTRMLLKDSWPLIFSAFFYMIYLRVDQVMLGNMVGSEELGNYSVAVQVSEAWFFIPVVICTSVFPAIVEADSISEELLNAHMRKLYSLMVLLSYGFALPVAFFSQTIIEVLFSSAYSAAGPLLAILAWTGLFTSLGAARNNFVISKNWTKINLVSTASGCVLNILLNFILIPRYGAMGAVVATFISYWFAVHGTCLFLKPLRETGGMMTKAMLYPKIW